MKKIITALLLTGALAGCETQGQSALAGTLAGATAGAILSDDKNRGRNTVLGGIAGASAGVVISQARNGNCVYERSDGSRYTAACP